MGGVVYMTNQPLTSEDSYVPLARDVINYTENRRRDTSRNTAMYLVLGGTVVLFLGIGGNVSVKKG